MKKLLSLLMILLTTGCVSAKLNIYIDQSDSGKVTYEIAYMEKYIIDNMFEKYDNLGDRYTVIDINYTKDDIKYIGKKISFEFKNLDEFNELFKNSLSSEVATETLTATRNKKIVTFNMNPNKTMYELYKNEINSLNYDVKITFPGKLIDTNGKLNKKVVSFEAETILKEGIQLKYNTSTNMLVLIPLITTFFITIAIYKLKSKQ